MTDIPKEPSESLLKFPCDFTVKVFGVASEEFEGTVLGIFFKHVPSFSESAVQSRPSENGKYLALTITIHVDSREQLDNLYRDLSASPLVLMAL